MSNKWYDETSIQNIANAIRSKNNLNISYKISEMANAINDFPLYEDKVEKYIKDRKIITSFEATCSIIGNNTFSNCSNLLNVNFPQCTYIGNNAFNKCSKLSTIDFPQCSYIGMSAFFDCDALTSVNLPQCSFIPQYAFAYCKLLSEINLPKCTKIGEYAFSRCTNLKSLYIGTSNCILDNINAFMNTPIRSGTGSIYVPSTYMNDYKNSTNWSIYSSIIFGY